MKIACQLVRPALPRGHRRRVMQRSVAQYRQIDREVRRTHQRGNRIRSVGWRTEAGECSFDQLGAGEQLDFGIKVFLRNRPRHHCLLGYGIILEIGRYQILRALILDQYLCRRLISRRPGQGPNQDQPKHYARDLQRYVLSTQHKIAPVVEIYQLREGRVWIGAHIAGPGKLMYGGTGSIPCMYCLTKRSTFAILLRGTTTTSRGISTASWLFSG